jgi:EpsI family protein
MGLSEPSDSLDRHAADGWWLVGVFVILLALYFSTIQSFYNIYSEEGSGLSHAPLLLLLILYLCYRIWSQTGRRIRLHFNRFVLLILTVLSLLWMVLGLVFVEAGQQAMVILIAAAVVIGMLGIRGGAKYLMPILLLLTVLPIWSLFIPYLQIIVAQASAYLIDISGITSIREGYLLVIPNGTFEVAESCSGMKFLIVGITLALIHTQLIKVPARVVLLYVLLASLLAFVSNVVRIFIVVIIGHYYGMSNEYVQDHNFIGWIVFSIFFFIFLFVGERRLRRHEIARQVEESGAQANAGMARRLSGSALVVLALSVGPAAYGYFTASDPMSNRDHISVLQQLPAWRATPGQLTDWTPLWTRGDRTFEGIVTKASERLDLFATEFDQQRQGHEAVNISHRVYDIEKWSRISKSARVIDVPGVGEVAVEETLLKATGHRKRLVWLWYRTNDKIVASKIQAKLNNLLGVLSGEPDISVFVVSKVINQNETHAADVLEAFLQAYLAQAGNTS